MGPIGNGVCPVLDVAVGVETGLDMSQAASEAQTRIQ